MSFTVTETHFGPFPTLTLDGGGARLVVAAHGATVLSWSVDGVELIDGCATPDELNAQRGARSSLMIPFSNRIRGGRYRFDGADYDFHANDPEHAGETVIHGMLSSVDFAVAEVTTDEKSASVRLVSAALRPGAFAGYPFAVDVAVDLTLTADGIELTVTGTNVGESVAPFASGWHPYFRFEGTPIEALAVTIPAATRIAIDDELIPLDGDGAFLPVADEWDFRAGQVLGDRVLDVAFGDLTVGPDGLSHSTVSDGASVIDVWQERGLMHVFTADTVDRPRGSFAMEPVEVMTNAFARPDCADAIHLEPGQSRGFRFGASFSRL